MMTTRRARQTGTGRFRIMPMPVIIALPAVGLVSSPAFRAILVAEHAEPGWVRPPRCPDVLLTAD